MLCKAFAEPELLVPIKIETQRSPISHVPVQHTKHLSRLTESPKKCWFWKNAPSEGVRLLFHTRRRWSR